MEAPLNPGEGSNPGEGLAGAVRQGPGESLPHPAHTTQPAGQTLDTQPCPFHSQTQKHRKATRPVITFCFIQT